MMGLLGEHAPSGEMSVIAVSDGRLFIASKAEDDLYAYMTVRLIRQPHR